MKSVGFEPTFSEEIQWFTINLFSSLQSLYFSRVYSSKNVKNLQSQHSDAR